MFEIGKKYRYNGLIDYEYECVAVLPSGNAVCNNSYGIEFIVSKKNFALYKEVKTPRTLISYMNIWESKKGELLPGMVTYKTEEQAKLSRSAEGVYQYIDTIKIEYTEKVS